jgi:DNA repair protein RadC
MKKKFNPNVISVAEVDLIYKSKVKATDSTSIKCSTDAYNVLLSCWEKDKCNWWSSSKYYSLIEQIRFWVYHLSTGGITGTVADPRLLFTASLKLNTCGVILAHNHPSGNLQPSRADEELTNKIKHAGNFLDIKVLDHVIVHSEGYYSFADEGNI